MWGQCYVIPNAQVKWDSRLEYWSQISQFPTICSIGIFTHPRPAKLFCLSSKSCSCGVAPGLISSASLAEGQAKLVAPTRTSGIDYSGSRYLYGLNFYYPKVFVTFNLNCYFQKVSLLFVYLIYVFLVEITFVIFGSLSIFLGDEEQKVKQYVSLKWIHHF